MRFCFKWPIRLVVRTPASHVGNTSSSLVWVTKLAKIFCKIKLKALQIHLHCESLLPKVAFKARYGVKNVAQTLKFSLTH